VTATHQEKVIREFTKHAATFGDPRLNMAFTANLARLVDFTEPELDPEDVVLEVCCGTGLVSRAIAGRVRHVTALDLTPAMLEEGKRGADQDAITNITFTLGNAAELPYVSRSFSLVITRFALHHVDDPAAVLREMVRVSRPGAGLIVADLVRPPAGPADRLERLRDPSHHELLPEDRIVELITEAGAEVKRFDKFDVVRPVQAWLEQVDAPPEVREQISAELRAELEGGPVTGLRPLISDGELCFTQANAYFGATAP
jgi:ubiquinone/menaquinone biosynthesis C-methylase UbiE